MEYFFLDFVAPFLQYMNFNSNIIFKYVTFFQDILNHRVKQVINTELEQQEQQKEEKGY